MRNLLQETLNWLNSLFNKNKIQVTAKRIKGKRHELKTYRIYNKATIALVKMGIPLAVVRSHLYYCREDVCYVCHKYEYYRNKNRLKRFINRSNYP